MISTASSLTKNPECKNTSRTAFSKFSASAGSNRRKPAVAFKTNGVLDQYSFGTNSLAFSNKCSIDSAPCFQQKQQQQKIYINIVIHCMLRWLNLPFSVRHDKMRVLALFQ